MSWWYGIGKASDACCGSRTQADRQTDFNLKSTAQTPPPVRRPSTSKTPSTLPVLYQRPQATGAAAAGGRYLEYLSQQHGLPVHASPAQSCLVSPLLAVSPHPPLMRLDFRALRSNVSESACVCVWPGIRSLFQACLIVSASLPRLSSSLTSPTFCTLQPPENHSLAALLPTDE